MPEGYLDVQPSPAGSTSPAIASEMFDLMLRNVTSADVVYRAGGAAEVIYYRLASAVDKDSAVLASGALLEQ